MSVLRKMLASFGIDPSPHQAMIIDSHKSGVAIDAIGYAAVHERAGAMVPPRPMAPRSTDWSGGCNSNPIDDIRAAVLKLGHNQIYGSMSVHSKHMGLRPAFASPLFVRYTTAPTIAEDIEQRSALDAIWRVWGRYVQQDAPMDEVVAVILYYCGHQFESHPLISVRMELSQNSGTWCDAVVKWPDSTFANHMIVTLQPRAPKPDKILWRSKLLTPSERAEAHTALDIARRSSLETDDDADRTAQ